MGNIIAFLKAVYQTEPTKEYIDVTGKTHKAKLARTGDCLVSLTYTDGKLTLSRVSSKKTGQLSAKGRPTYEPSLTNSVTVKAESLESGIERLLNGKHNLKPVTVVSSGYRTLIISANKTDISLTSFPSANNPARSKSVIKTKKTDFQKLAWLPVTTENFIDLVKQAKLSYGLQSSEIVDL